jgi:hypothetical protein
MEPNMPTATAAGSAVVSGDEVKSRKYAVAVAVRLAASRFQGWARSCSRRIEFAGRPPGQLQLGMGADVIVGQDRVVVLGEHAAARADQQRPERRLSGRPPGGGQLDRPAEKALVFVRHRSSSSV